MVSVTAKVFRVQRKNTRTGQVYHQHMITLPADYCKQGEFKHGDLVRIETLKNDRSATSDNADLAYWLESTASPPLMPQYL